MAHKLRSQEDRNFYHLVIEVAWFGLAFVTINRFLSVYALRVGATPTELAWIVAGPPIGMTLASIISVWWRRRFADSVRAVQLPTFLFRLSFLLLAITPVFPLRWQPLWMVLAVTVPSLPQGLSNVMFLTLLKEVTPEHRMTPLLGRRIIALNLALGVGALMFGIWLENVPFPTNYALMFVFAFVAAMISQWHLSHVKTIDEEAAAPMSLTEKVRPLQDTRFRRMFIVNFFGHIAFFSVFPVVTMRLVEDLGATEGYMATFSAVELAAGALVGFTLSSLVRRWGNRHTLGFALMGTALAALMIGWLPSLKLAIIAAVVNGLAWAMTDISMIGYFTESYPTRSAAYYTRAYGQGMWTAMFIAPFIGTQLAELGVPLSVVLTVGAALRIAAGLFALSDVAAVRRRRHIFSAGYGD